MFCFLVLIILWRSWRLPNIRIIIAVFTFFSLRWRRPHKNLMVGYSIIWYLILIIIIIIIIKKTIPCRSRKNSMFLHLMMLKWYQISKMFNHSFNLLLRLRLLLILNFIDQNIVIRKYFTWFYFFHFFLYILRLYFLIFRHLTLRLKFQNSRRYLC